jgi:hypothetical protein
MSIGNLKTEGNKGNNFPYQLKVLQGLQCVCDQLKELNIDTTAIEATLLDIEAAIGNLATEATLLNVENILQNVETNTTGLATETTLLNVETATQAIETNTTGVARTPNFLRPTGSLGTVTAGTFSMSFASVGTGNATVGGMTLKPGETINFDAGALNNTLGAVAYDTTTTGAELIIITLT